MPKCYPRRDPEGLNSVISEVVLDFVQAADLKGNAHEKFHFRNIFIISEILVQVIECILDLVK